MNGPVTIRPLARSDAKDWRRLWRDYLAFYDTELSPQVFDAQFDRLLDPGQPAFNARIAEVGGHPVGLVHFIYHPHGWRLEDVCYLQDLYADPDARGHGIGRALIEAVYTAADENGTPSVYWLTQDFNRAARLLYDRVGVLTPFIKYQRP